MLEQIKAWERAGQWVEIRSNEHIILSTLTGSDLARALLAIGKAYEVTAATAAEYRTALRHTEAILDLMPAGSLIHTWALHRIAAERADLGDFAGAQRAALAFIADLPNHPAAEAVAPYAYAALGRAHHYGRRPAAAIPLFRRALLANVGGEFQERVQLLLVWSLAAAGRIYEAFGEIPSDVEHISRGHLFGAVARVCLAARDWHGAHSNARLALRSFDAGEWLPYDLLQAAELCLILKRASLALGCSFEAAVWFDQAAVFALGNADLMAVLAATLGRIGGEWPEAATVSRGLPAGHKRCGLLGAVG